MKYTKALIYLTVLAALCVVFLSCATSNKTDSSTIWQQHCDVDPTEIGMQRCYYLPSQPQHPPR